MGYFLHHLGHLFEMLHCHLERLGHLAITQVDSTPSKELIVSGDESGDDAAMVMKRLGLWSSDDDEETESNRLMDAAYKLLDEKEARLEEVDAAFGVFDEDGDGLIGAEELRAVMRRLGLEEGLRLEDCRRMIEAYDEDGDGHVSLSEFKNMLECAL
ncbi:hypothetical protein OPV22_026403 [Ensete ventricosum]|uniref:EF-hand domain-containing protein n=1 Tax=Ensete ventricosum TaxID=4639 RepID=A0AAV8QCI2_ENSVE|nr:hypothetical protein OPV22_026403 [Ensete ventricosum]